MANDHGEHSRIVQKTAAGKEKPMKRRRLRAVLAAALAFSLTFNPMSAFAAEGAGTASGSDVAISQDENGLKDVPWYWQPGAVRKIDDQRFDNFNPETDREKLMEAWIDAMLAWSPSHIYITISDEQMDEIMQKDTYTPSEVGSWWNSWSQNLQTESRTALISKTSRGYETYMSGQQAFLVALSADGYSEAKQAWTFHLTAPGKRDTYEQELEVREKVQSIFAPGGALYPYRASNDLYSDWEKYVAVWEWFEQNVNYAYTSSSSYGVIVQGRGICQAYSLGNNIMCAYAGIDNLSVTGYLDGAGHAWSWVQIGDKWMQSDTTANSEYSELDLSQSFPIQEKYGHYTLWHTFITEEMQQEFPKHEDKFFEEGYVYDGGIIGTNLTWVFENGTLTISGEGNMRNFDDPYLVPWRSYSDQIEKVVINDGVDSIGNNAFYASPDIQQDNEATFSGPSDLIVGDHAFYNPNDPVTEFNAQMEAKIEPSVAFDNAKLSIDDLVDAGWYGTEKATSSDYSVSYSTDNGLSWVEDYPKNIGEYQIKITLKGKTKNVGGVLATFAPATEIINLTITKASIAISKIEPNFGRIYDGTTKVSVMSVISNPSHGGNIPQVNRDYEIVAEYVSPDAGTDVAQVKELKILRPDLMNNYNWSYPTGLVRLQTKILQKTITEDMFEPIPDQPYIEGQAATPLPKITSEEDVIMDYDDFTVSYENNTGIGTASVTITGKNNYKDSVTLNFKISPDVTVAPRMSIYADKTHNTPAINFTYGNPLYVSLAGVTDSDGQNVRLTVADASTQAGETIAVENVVELSSSTVAGGVASFTYETTDKKLPVGVQTLAAIDDAGEVLATAPVILDAKQLAVTLSKAEVTAAKGYDTTAKVLNTNEGGRHFTFPITSEAVLSEDQGAAILAYDLNYDSPEIGSRTLHVTNIHFNGEAGTFYKPDQTSITVADSETEAGLVRIYSAYVTHTATFNSKPYDGTDEPLIDAFTWNGLFDGDELVMDRDYTVEAKYLDSNAGNDKQIQYTIRFNNTDVGKKYTFENGATFIGTADITPLELNNGMFKSIDPQPFTGEAIQPTIEDLIQHNLLTMEDLDVKYGQNISGTGTIEITGKRNFTGKLTLSFAIEGNEEPEPPVSEPVMSAELRKDGAVTTDFTYGDTVTVTGNLTGVDPSKNTAVQLQDANGIKLAEGTTGVNGEFSFIYDTSGKGLTIGDNTLYVVATVNGKNIKHEVSAMLDKKPITVEFSGDAAKAYDGDTSVPQNNSIKIAIEGKIKNDNVTATADYEFADVIAGTTKVSAANIQLGGEHAKFYTLANEEPVMFGVTTGITRAPSELAFVNNTLEITEGDDAKLTYTFNGDGAINASVMNADNNQAVQDAKISYDADNKMVTISGLAAGNYKVTLGAEAGTNFEAPRDVQATIEVRAASLPDPVITAEIYKGNVEFSDFTYGDTITVKGKIENLPADAVATVSLMNGETKLTSTVLDTGTASYKLTYNTAKQGLPIGNGGSLTVRVDVDNKSAETTVTYNLARKRISVVFDGDATKKYDGKASVPKTHSITATPADLVRDDTVTASAEYTFTNVNAGTKEVRATDIRLAGKDADYYTLASADPVTFKVDTGITKATSLISFIDGDISIIAGEQATITYEFTGDGSLVADAVDAQDDPVPEDAIRLDTAEKTVTISGLEEGTYTLTLTAKAGNNYKGTSETILIKVIPRSLPTITAELFNGAAQQANFTYGQELKAAVSAYNFEFNQDIRAQLLNGDDVLAEMTIGADQNTASPLVFDLVYDTSLKGIDPGTADLTVKVTSGAEEASATISPTLTQKPVYVTFEGDTTKTYDGTTDVTDLDSLTVNVEDVIEGDQVTASVVYAFVSETANTKEVTASNIILSGEDARFYTYSGPERQTFEVAGGITKAPSEFQASQSAITITEGETVDLTYTYNGDGTVSVNVSAEGSTDPAGQVNHDPQGKRVTVSDLTTGSYMITFSASEGVNYLAPSTSAVVVTVKAESPAPEPEGELNATMDNLTPTADGSVTYGDQAVFQVTLESPADADTADTTDTETSVETTDPVAATREASSSIENFTGALYLQNADGSLTPLAASVESGINTYTFTYDTSSKNLTPGTYTLVARLTGNPSYRDIQVSSDVTIMPRSLTASLTGDATKVEDGSNALPADSTMAISLVGLMPGDSVTATAASMVFGGTTAGTTSVLAQNVTLSGADAPFYFLTDANLTASVTGITAAATPEPPTTPEEVPPTTPGQVQPADPLPPSAALPETTPVNTADTKIVETQAVKTSDNGGNLVPMAMSSVVSMLIALYAFVRRRRS